MALVGKGFFIWKIKTADGGKPTDIVSAAKEAGLTHVLIKIADGAFPYNYDRATNKDYIPPVVDALKAAGIQVWGWHYIYGGYPEGEARIAISQTKKYNLDGYVIDAEAEFKQPGKSAAADTFGTMLRAGITNIPVALSSYRFPSLHSEFPWKTFLNYSDLNMPQVYWMGSHNPGPQLRRCVSEFSAMKPVRPIIPTGIAVGEDGWEPTTGDQTEFLNSTVALNIKAANFWEWGECRVGTHPIWNTIAAYKWPFNADPYNPTLDIAEKYVALLNKNSADAMADLYASTIVHITSSETVQGLDAVKKWYRNFFLTTFPSASYVLTSHTLDDHTCNLTWTATGPGGSIKNGSETLGLVNGKITYQYSSFNITA